MKKLKIALSQIDSISWTRNAGSTYARVTIDVGLIPGEEINEIIEAWRAAHPRHKRRIEYGGDGSEGAVHR